MLIIDDIARAVADRAGDRDNGRLNEIKGYIRGVVLDLSRLMRSGGIYRTASNIAVTDGEFTLPEGCAAVLAVYDGLQPYDIQTNKEFRTRELGNVSFPTVQIFEDVPFWKGKLLGGGTGGTVTIDYLIRTDNVSSLPSYYSELVMTGAEAQYHLRRTKNNLSVYDRMQARYQDMKKEFKNDQSINTGQSNRIYSLEELERQDPSAGYNYTRENDRRYN
jgi:hypothetical protein